MAGIYLRGKHDIFFYEFLYEVCGDKLLPFLIYYASKLSTSFVKHKLINFHLTDFILRLNKQKIIKYEAEKTNPSRFKIAQRTQIIAYRIQRLNPPAPRSPPITLPSQPRPIIIHYGHPFSTKKMKKSHAKTDDKKEIHQNAENLRSFNQRIVILKGRLKKPITNFHRRDYFQNFHTMTL